MDFKVVLMPSALHDLKQITSRIAHNDPGIALDFGNQLMDCTASLTLFPNLGRMIPEFKDPHLRELIQAPYRVIYRVRTQIKEIHILRFWHAARGQPVI